ncbi:P-loop containing nucleoside triphosphate hydrolase protein [Boletus reticuloceps]|uniref:P-loop containing nucleoside triphosphate hydrolase protein n=1 Tax=Boletus reticuloceps TaxID=495285 RepID=A0A8I2YSB4_9AGAM|nr:P-loop containing nucleoside triphosphate hydrolase protein [Boletus reticuloceps]
MADYLAWDRPSPTRYEHGIDAKIVVMGNTGVGKTSLLHRYTQNKFDPRNVTSTTGAFFVTKKVYIDGLKVRLQLWDTAGQERFRSMVRFSPTSETVPLADHSQAPMYYRGANAALLLYDITNASTFDDIRELKKNCPPELIIYIVGSKADLHHQRQVTSDLARLSLHNWFPPPRPPSPPPPPPPPPPSTYHTSVRDQRPPQEPSRCAQSRFGPNVGRYVGGWSDNAESSSNSLDEDEAEDGQEWGLHQGMELFEVSAKDNLGIQALFDSLIGAIIDRKDIIERENELRKRDSVLLTSPSTPTWAAQAEEEEAREKARSSSGGWSCCSS